ncbi:hypothetical protein N7466_003809 [Penicillium verhagenii]|uniref:uncharacterized protein n=1 Tax=Penicillium verhagenii TaxID=1562060 RepID=UPI00254538A8|nr:uncharacterized protein N7466_003809 [Penicillium verhagenii]KAJ5934262.1 hypothetical protein N7466_003809 [Penicillium verhagenii]
MASKDPIQPQSSIGRTYLVLYNATCAALWLSILVTTAKTWIQSPDITAVYKSAEPLTRYTQTLAVVEILHAALQITRSPVFTTFTQVFARSVQVWAINYAFPSATAPSVAYTAMLLAWSSADTIRYLYFAIMQAGYPVPALLKWSRYSLFLALYPVGISSEWWLMYKATTIASNWAVLGIFYFFLGLYVPGKHSNSFPQVASAAVSNLRYIGSVMMYSYMLKQRRKVLTKN